MIKSGDSKEIRLKEFSYALERMESLKSGNELTNKIVEIQGTQIHSKGDRKSTRLNSSHGAKSRMPSSA